ncbi:MAG: hypothetical protein COY42_32730 [Armatimonadetes bacterium CG_4_10_14_0_8_um_filter_66_14]|nr:hypothetical protein [Armatimonadota bacterium]NDK12215.1 hypothetical protein [Armatimonadota bacterium]PIX37526.1 MAG: hypothetical protein COZ57_33890 [Armatimonadetes bacterium CG_4_8_14_3_um_filter_66_20]PIZ31294.1 MAG: hypothetical protein COY42_32730 [Armatimonadetes bacterium CG_4_10_14_0_8_um_filter_66_14]
MRSTIALTALLLAAQTGQAANAKLPDGVALYWNCDDDDGFGWRDNHWQEGGSPNVTYDTNNRRYGKASLRIVGVADQELSVVSLAAPAAVDPGTSYVLRFWARTEGLKGEAMVRLLAHGPVTADKQYDPLGWVRLSPKVHCFLSPDSEWTLHEVPFDQVPGGAARLFVYLAVKGVGTVWWDEVSIAKVGVAVPLGGAVELADADYSGVRFIDGQLPANLLQNGDFEKGMQGWQVFGSGSTAKVEAVNGGHALRFDAKEFTGLYAVQRVRVDPRRRYRLSLRARTEGTGLVGYFFTQILPFNQHGTPTGWAGADHASEFTYVTGTTKDWVERRQDFTVRPDSDAIGVFLRVEDTIGTVWVGAVRLEPLPLTAAP